MTMPFNNNFLFTELYDINHSCKCADIRKTSTCVIYTNFFFLKGFKLFMWKTFAKVN